MGDNSFRSAQVVGDLVHHVKPLLAVHLGAVSQASGLTPAETGAAFRGLRDDGFRFREQGAALRLGLEAIAATGAEGFELAVVVLLVDAVQGGRAFAASEMAAQRLGGWPATLRAAVAQGLGLDGVTRGAAEIAEALLRVARSMRRDELYAVAERGGDLTADFAALMQGIGQRDGIMSGAALEVVELGARLPKQVGYEGCTAILLLNALYQGDGRGFAARWQEQGAVYCALQPSRRDAILAGVRYFYETDPGFLADQPVQGASRLGEGAIIPVVEDL
jgi:hypothetical protein